MGNEQSISFSVPLVPVAQTSGPRTILTPRVVVGVAFKVVLGQLCFRHRLWPRNSSCSLTPCLSTFPMLWFDFRSFMNFLPTAVTVLLLRELLVRVVQRLFQRLLVPIAHLSVDWHNLSLSLCATRVIKNWLCRTYELMTGDHGLLGRVKPEAFLLT